MEEAVAASTDIKAAKNGNVDGKVLDPKVEPFVPIDTSKVEGAQEETDWGDEDEEDGANILDSGLGLDPTEEEGSRVELQKADPTEPYKSATSFEEIGLSEELLKGIYAMKFQKPSKIQAASLPLILPSADGTRRNLPTRELARQIVDVIKLVGKFTKARVRLVVKETDEERRLARSSRKSAGLESPASHIIVGTPGKLMDLVKKRQVDLASASVCVLDEADEMVNTQGMGDQTLRIKRHLPDHAQILLFSATYSNEVQELAKRMAPNSNVIWVKKETLSLDKIKQVYFRVPNSGARYQVIQDIYDSLTLGQTIIFVRTRQAAKMLTDNLRADGNAVSVLYGGSMSPEERDRVIDEFRTGVTKVLVTTNVLSRGVDVRAITAVINYDLPTDKTNTEADPESYLHRIGRTGRFGTKGIAINLVYDDNTMRVLNDLERYYDKKIQLVAEVEQLEEALKSI